MALEAPLRSSTGSHLSAFSYSNDMSSVDSPDSAPLRSPFVSMPSVASSPADSHSLRPSSVQRVSANNHLMSPSELIGPSPVTSNGTSTTEIDDEISEEALARPTAANPGPRPQFMMLNTSIPDSIRKDLAGESMSVIHAPENYGTWKNKEDSKEKNGSPPLRTSPKFQKEESVASDATINSSRATKTMSLPAPPPLSTDVRPVRYSIDSATPQAQDLQDMLSDQLRIRSSSASSLEKIEETREPDNEHEHEQDAQHSGYTSAEYQEDSEIQALQTALQECWTLCNTLASLSSIHRARVFNSSGIPNAHERAWKSCWKLCQRLYDNRDEDADSFNVRANLDLCRDFCQALFDIRTRIDEVADSVLRVSFELNNHLYSAQDNRNLPEIFRERTLDFYITLCHRLMKQRSELAEETDSLLRACWSLAEMLFSLRQNKRDGKAPDEELLGSAVQACWELCDIFRDGWTQVRPDRNTPRPSQTTFFGTSSGYQLEASSGGRESRQSDRSSLHSKRESHKGMSESRQRKPPPVPETPVTEFEDTPISPESSSPGVPNIMVLGTNSDSARAGGRWSSSASNLSSYSQSSTKTSSTATTATVGEDANIMRIKVLILKAAMNVGYSREGTTDGKAGVAALQSFVKALPTGSFGNLPQNAHLLQGYKNLVLADPAFRTATLPPRGKRVMATEMVKSVQLMMQRSNQHAFLRDLFRLVFSFPIEEAAIKPGVSIAV